MADRNLDGPSTMWNPLSGKFWNNFAATTTPGGVQTYVFKQFTTDNIAIQLNWTGTVKGVFTVQVCLDYRENETGAITQAGTWTDVTANAVAKYPFVTTYGTAPSGANTGPFLICMQFVPNWAIQLTYTADATTPGSGNINGYYTAKGF